MKTIRETCVICGHTSDQPVLYVKDGFPITRCPHCALGRTHLTPDVDLAGIYNDGYFTGGQDYGYGDYLGSEPALHREFQRTLALLRTYAPPGGRLLEIGSAYGFFLLDASRYYKATGIEISREGAEFAASRGLDARCGTTTRELLEEIGPVDVVVMLDVLEHLENPQETIRLLSESLKPGGILLAITCNFSSLHARITGKHWRLMSPPLHTCFFNPHNLRLMMTQAGLETVRMDTPWRLVPVGLIAYQLGLRWKSLESLHLSVPVNLFDTLRVVARKKGSS